MPPWTKCKEKLNLPKDLNKNTWQVFKLEKSHVPTPKPQVNPSMCLYLRGLNSTPGLFPPGEALNQQPGQSPSCFPRKHPHLFIYIYFIFKSPNYIYKPQTQTQPNYPQNDKQTHTCTDASCPAVSKPLIPTPFHPVPIKTQPFRR